MATRAPLDRARLASLMARERERFTADHPRSAALFERGQGPRCSTASRCPGWSSGPSPFPPFVESASGRPLPLRRRPRLRRLLPRRHRRDGRPRPRADHRRGRTTAAPRDHPHAPDRGCRLGRRGADPPLRRRRVAVRPVRVRRQSLVAATGPPRHRPVQGGRPRPLLPRLGRRGDRDARRRAVASCRCAARSAPRSTWPRRPGSSISTTSTDSRRRSPTARSRRS